MPQKAMMRQFMQNYLKKDIKAKDCGTVNAIMRDMMAVSLEGALDQELDQERGYSKQDYCKKETGNSRNDHSQKIMHAIYGNMQIDVPQNRNGESEPQIVKATLSTISDIQKQSGSGAT